ncbi:MAG TPA: four helix bundle protein [Coleofasciculaceae cyanobacterium]|jgi:four helix bundle protein
MMNGEKQKNWDIRERSFKYALRAIKLYQCLQEGKDGAGWIIAKQYLRSATSIGANVEEAQSGESRADFIHKYSIAQKEARESLYWLRLLAESGLIPNKRLIALIGETEELISVITAIIVSAKQNKP